MMALVRSVILLDLDRIEVIRDRVDVHENRSCTTTMDASYRGEEGKRRENDFVSRPDFESVKSQEQRMVPEPHPGA